MCACMHCMYICMYVPFNCAFAVPAMDMHCSNQASLIPQPVAEAVSNIQLLIAAGICDRDSSMMCVDAAHGAVRRNYGIRS